MDTVKPLTILAFDFVIREASFNRAEILLVSDVFNALRREPAQSKLQTCTPILCISWKVYRKVSKTSIGKFEDYRQGAKMRGSPPHLIIFTQIFWQPLLMQQRQFVVCIGRRASFRETKLTFQDDNELHLPWSRILPEPSNLACKGAI